MDAFSIYQTIFMIFMTIWLAPVCIGITLYKDHKLNYANRKFEQLFIPFKGVSILADIICDSFREGSDQNDSCDKAVSHEEIKSVRSKNIGDKNFFSQALKNNYPMIHLDDYNELISEYEDITYDKTVYNINRNKNSPELINAIESYIKYRFKYNDTVDHMASPYSFFLESKLILYLINHEMSKVLYESFVEDIEILIHSYTPGQPYSFKHKWKELLGVWINNNKQIVLVISYNKDGDLEVYNARHQILLTK